MERTAAPTAGGGGTGRCGAAGNVMTAVGWGRLSGVLRHNPQNFELDVDTFEDRVVGGHWQSIHGRGR